MTQDYSVEVSLCRWTNNTNTKLDILEWYSIWWIKSTTLYFPYGSPVHFDQKWTSSPAQPQWVGLVGIKIAPFSAGMQTCGEIWPGPRDSSSPAFLYVSHSDTNLRPESAGPVFPRYVHNKLEQRCSSEMMACGLSHAQCPPSLSSLEKPHFLSSCISSHGEVAGFNGQSSGKNLARHICHCTWGHILWHVHYCDIDFLYKSPDLDFSNIRVGFFLQTWTIQQTLCWYHSPNFSY